MQSPEDELLKTEENYSNFLEFFINSYKKPMEKWLQILKHEFEATEDTSSILCSKILQGEDIILGLFSNVEQLFLLHQFLYQHLNAVGRNRIEIVRIFSKYGKSLLLYRDYIQNSEHSRQLLTELKKDIRY